MSKRILLLIILFLISSAFHIRIININLNPYDEAVILVGAERILKGDVPYKDFFSQYTPGQYYTLAAIFKAFGISVLTERIYDILIKSLLSIFVFLIINLVSSNKYALIGWAMSLIWGGHINFPAYPVYPSLLFIYISIYLLLLYFKQDKTYYINLSAISIVFAILFRHDLGGMAAIIITFVLIIMRIMKVRLSWAPLIHFLGTCIMAGLPIIIYFFLYSDIEAVISNLIIFPLGNFQKFQDIPYPRHISLHTLPFFVFPVILFIGLITALFRMKRRTDNTITYEILLISLIGNTFIIQASGRSDIVHLLPLGITSILLAPILLYTFLKEMSFKYQHRLFVITFLAIFSITLYKPIIMRIKSFPEKYTIKIVNPDIPRAKYTQLRDAEIKKVIAFIKKNTSENEFIYSGLKNHDRLVFNNALIYFLAERMSATKYHELNPGFTTLPEVQKEMVNELRSRDVRLIVLIPGLWNKPNLNDYEQEIDVLDNYISDNFELKESFGTYEIMMRKQS